MEFEKFEARLNKNQNKPLPGPEAQYKMTPAGRPRQMPDFDTENPPKRAAVSALFHLKDGLAQMVLIKRPSYPGVHGGQIAFPGGGLETQDTDLLATALRETEEEIGVSPRQLQLYRKISPLYIPPSHYYVQPFLMYAKTTLKFTPQPSEVEAVLELPLSHFFEAQFCRDVSLEVRGNRITVPAFCIGPHVIWGATAMMINEIITLLQE